MKKILCIPSDTRLGLGMFIFSIILLFQALGDFKTYLIPVICISGIGILGLFIALSPYFENEKSTPDQTNINEDLKTSHSPWTVRGFLSIFLIILCAQIIPWMGFILSTFIILIGLLICSGEKWFKAFYVSFATNAIFLVLFTHVIYLPLPLGVGPFRSLSLFVKYFIF